MLERIKLVKKNKMVISQKVKKSQSLTLTLMVKWQKCLWTKLVGKSNILLDNPTNTSGISGYMRCKYLAH